MKKLLLSLGTVAAIAAPVASVIACGKTTTPKATTAPKATTPAELLKAEKSKDIEIVNKGAPRSLKEQYTMDINATKDMTSLTKVMVDIKNAIRNNKFNFFKLGSLESSDLTSDLSHVKSIIEYMISSVVNGMSYVIFTLDGGPEIKFDFSKDKFLHDGLSASGEYTDYISQKQPLFKVENGKLYTVDLAPSGFALKPALSELIRMMVAAKTKLHYDGTAWTM